MKAPKFQERIVLIGFMGAGKTAVGKKLAQLLGGSFQDLDLWIEKKNRRSVSSIFLTRGEKYFRKQERIGIRVLTRRSGMVLATGGGAWMDPVNRRLLKKWGTVVWLKVRFSTVWKRVSSHRSKRPLVGRSIRPSADFRSLFEKRQKTYSRADLVVPTDDRTPFQSCKLVLKKLRTKPPVY